MSLTKLKFISVFFIAIGLFFSCKDNTEMPAPIDLSRLMAGGETTVFELSSAAFETPASNLTGANLEQHLAGDAAFEQAFVTPPAPVNQGLGSIFNNNSCIACHPKDGRSPHPSDLNSFTGLFIKASIPGTDIHGGPNPVPGFGDQIQQNSVFSTIAEADFAVTYTKSTVTMDDGTKVILRKPVYYLVNTYIPLPSQVMLSPRVAPPVFGLGLLEAIPEADILARADENDNDSDGISGKANYVWNFETSALELGRFGWKAINPTILQQSANAYNNDIGITNPFFPVENSFGQTNNTDLHANDPELNQQELDDVTFYCRTLAVPAPRNIENKTVIKGEKIFHEIQCAKCHVPKQVTGFFEGIPEISNQTIYPYTDMLLHDMGFGLADDRPSFKANGQEWKTRQLWGIGLTKVVNGHTNFLHDGRARNLTEAILWHGGEAANSISQFKSLSAEERAALITFLNSL